MKTYNNLHVYRHNVCVNMYGAPWWRSTLRRRQISVLFQIMSKYNRMVLAVKDGSIQSEAEVILEAPNYQRKLSQLWYQDDEKTILSAKNNFVLSARANFAGKC